MEEIQEKKQGKIGTFLDQVKGEMRKVTWPTRSELYGATAVVIAVTFLVSVLTGGLDFVVGKIMEFVITIPQ
jgi:preprotein translocase subunit SecE